MFHYCSAQIQLVTFFCNFHIHMIPWCKTVLNTDKKQDSRACGGTINYIHTVQQLSQQLQCVMHALAVLLML